MLVMRRGLVNFGWVDKVIKAVGPSGRSARNIVFSKLSGIVNRFV